MGEFSVASFFWEQCWADCFQLNADASPVVWIFSTMIMMIESCTMKLLKRSGVLVCVVAASFLLAATTTLPQSTTSQQPTATPGQPLRVTSRLVQVSVIVRHKGAPVTGLTKDDFTVLDQNRPQQIADFSEQSYDPGLASRPADTPRNTSAAFTNRFNPDSGIPTSVTIILLDALNTPRQQMAN